MKIYKTIYDKIYDKAICSKIPKMGDYAALRPDFALGHDPLIAIIVDDFERNEFKIERSILSKCFFTADHFAPPANVERANILKKFLDFSYKNKIKNLKIFEGICHQLMVEYNALTPFSYVIGSDSHTCTAGALSCLAAGYGSMDILHALVKGYIYERKYPVVRVNFNGTAPEFIDGRDISFTLIDRTGEGGANGAALEYFDVNASLAMDDRFSIACATVETGAAAGIFAADNTLTDYIRQRNGGRPDILQIKSLAAPGLYKKNAKQPGFILNAGRRRNKKTTFPSASWRAHGGISFERYYRDISFEYDSNIDITLDSLEPLIAQPHDFTNITPVSKIKNNVSLDQVFIGSCASGRFLDFKRMCAIIDLLENKKREKYYYNGAKQTAASNNVFTGIKRAGKTRLIITPASQKIFIEAMKAGYIEKLINFGAVITNPSCGPCGGIDKGIIAGGETCLTTATRNFKGRMGPPSSNVYLSSAATAIYSAYTGKLSDWREIFNK